ncbi:hypothetical protein [Pantoea sp. B65]|uniref:hypothetical protein n=1 Tax=Pantoea sp. B65 TaxID=2813359 RepID=UPI0039B3C878
MKKSVVYTSFATILLATSIASATPARQSVNRATDSINSCADLLPAGEIWTITISGTIDKTANSKDENFTGTFNLYDSSNIAPSEDQKKRREPFIWCVSELIK